MTPIGNDALETFVARGRAAQGVVNSLAAAHAEANALPSVRRRRRASSLPLEWKIRLRVASLRSVALTKKRRSKRGFVVHDFAGQPLHHAPTRAEALQFLFAWLRKQSTGKCGVAPATKTRPLDTEVEP